MATNIDKTKFSGQESSYSQMPAFDAAAITKHDTTTFNGCRAFWVGTGGDVKAKMSSDFAGTGGATVTFKNVPQGTLLPFSIIQVFDTGSTASDLVAVY
jgi:hypothetical protein